MRTIVHASIVVAMAVGLMACGKSPTQPTPASSGPTLNIVGVQIVTAIGQTFQLKATSGVSGQTPKDVTSDTQWASSDPSVATVSEGGLVTVVGIGLGDISAKYQSLTVTQRVTAVPVAWALNFTGNPSLSAVGDTSQLHAMVSLLSGGTADATNYVTWTTMTVPSVVRVSKGLLTADALGWGEVSASYPGAGSRVFPITVTPPGTFIVGGFVKLPGHAGVAGFHVLDTQSGRSTIASSSGNYSPGWYTLGGLTDNTRLTFDKAGYEPAELVLTGPVDPLGGEVKVQQLYRITAGDTVQTTIAPHDVEYDVSPSGPCVSCRLIRVVNPAPGTLHLKLTWNVATAALSLWVNGERFAGTRGGPLTVDVPADAGELVLYVGVGTVGLNYVTMTLTTSLTAPEPNG
jgi:hypothetical protein